MKEIEYNDDVFWANNVYAVERSVDMHGDGERDYTETIAWFLDENNADEFSELRNADEPGAYRVIDMATKAV